MADEMDQAVSDAAIRYSWCFGCGLWSDGEVWPCRRCGCTSAGLLAEDDPEVGNFRAFARQRHQEWLRRMAMGYARTLRGQMGLGL